jgi:hypothetical protein
MFRTRVFLAAALLVAGLHAASAQSTSAPAAAPSATAPAAAPASTDAKPSRMKLTMQKLKEMKAKWAANRPKLKACRAEVKSKGLTGDDRWFYVEDCMNKS